MARSQRKQNPNIHNQNFLHLGCIQSAAIGLPGIIFGGMLGTQYGTGVALLSICVGNLILWLIGLSIISMVYNNRINAIENIKNYLGRTGTLIAALFLVLIFLNWFALQINSTVFLLDKALHFETWTRNDMTIRLGAAFGFIISLLAVGGIHLLKWIAVASAPILFVGQIYISVNSEYQLPFSGLGLSFSAVTAAILVFLPGLINLPTFFRHSRSKADSYLGLIFMILYYTFFECTGIWINLSDLFNNSGTGNLLHYANLLIISCFIIILLLCSNLLNIYLASACYETFIPRFSGTRGHAIMGLLGTATYTFVQISFPIQFLIDLLNAYLTSLGVVLLIAFLIRVVVKHRPRKMEKGINSSAWLIGCLVATVLKIQSPNDEIQFLFVGTAASSLFFLITIYIEETTWSAKKIISEKL